METGNQWRQGGPHPSDTPIDSPDYRGRTLAVLAMMGALCLAVTSVAFYRQIWQDDFLQNEGAKRHLDVEMVPAMRGVIRARSGEPLAVSAPADAVTLNPKQLIQHLDEREKKRSDRVMKRKNRELGPEEPVETGPDRQDPWIAMMPLAQALGVRLEAIKGKVMANPDRGFMVLERGLEPQVSQQIHDWMNATRMDGIALQREYQRFYPEGEVFAQVVGFAGRGEKGKEWMEKGLEGLELALDKSLVAQPGRKRVLRDGHKLTLDVESLEPARDGQDVILSIDRRIQYLAYNAIKEAVIEHGAEAASMVVLDARTGEILAMANYPSYNPNGPRDKASPGLRNRAVTDLFEPGSTMKPFSIALALSLGVVRPETPFDTSPGRWTIVGKTITDTHNYGLLDVTGIIRKSSNVGTAKIADKISAEAMGRFYQAIGLGQLTSIGFPGERAGHLAPYKKWRKIEQITMSYGYGLNLTLLQLARAYQVFANEGKVHPVSILRLDAPPPAEETLRPEIALTMRQMLEGAVGEGGTGTRAAVKGYRVAGKTGTAQKIENGVYRSDKHTGVFAGMIPASDPRLIAAVLVDSPTKGGYYGGLIAAPAFFKVMSAAVRFMDIPPDAPDRDGLRLADVSHPAPIAAGGAR